MMTILRAFIYVVIAIAAGVCFFAWHYRVPVTRYALSTVLNNPVSLSDVDVSLSLSRINGRNVAIENPIRSQDAYKYAIKTRIFELRTGFLNWFKSTLNIQEIYLDRVYVFVDMYNLRGSESNVKSIIANVKDRALERHPDGKKHKQPVIINKIILQDIHFSYRNPFLTTGVVELPKPIKRIELTNIGTDHPVSAGQIASIIVTALLKHFATLSGFKHAIESLPKMPLDWFKNIFIKEGNNASVSFESYLHSNQPSTSQPISFFKKIFISPRKEDEDGEIN